MTREKSTTSAVGRLLVTPASTWPSAPAAATLNPQAATSHHRMVPTEDGERYSSSRRASRPATASATEPTALSAARLRAASGAGRASSISSTPLLYARVAVMALTAKTTADTRSPGAALLMDRTVRSACSAPTAGTIQAITSRSREARRSGLRQSRAPARAHRRACAAGVEACAGISSGRPA